MMKYPNVFRIYQVPSNKILRFRHSYFCGLLRIFELYESKMSLNVLIVKLFLYYLSVAKDY